MKLEVEQVLCRFHLSTSVRHGAEPLYRWILAVAHDEDLQGATVLKGIMGLRADGTLLCPGRWRLDQEVPVIVESVDGPRCIERLLARVEPVFHQGEITLERAHVALYRPASPAPLPREAARKIDVIATTEAGAAWEVKTMKLAENGVLLRIFLGESDEDAGQRIPLYRSIVEHARAAGLAGATVLKGPMGFGRHSRVHTATLLDLSTDLPVVVEIVDTEEKIDAFMPVVDALVSEGMVTLEAVRVLRYSGSPDAGIK